MPASSQPASLRPDYPRASFLRRMGGCLYDGLLTIALSMTVTALYLGALAAIRGQEEIKAAAAAGETLSGPLLSLLLIASILGFFCYFWHKTGQTLGMQAWRLRVETTTGETLNWRLCLLRFLAASLSWLCLGLGFLAILWGRNRLAWHDRLTNSRVVTVPANQRRKNSAP